MAATPGAHSTNRNVAVVARVEKDAWFLALELGWSEGKLAFARGPADRPRLRSLGRRNTQALLLEIAKAKKRFDLADDAPVCGG
jgi:hypothetical protein